MGVPRIPENKVGPDLCTPASWAEPPRPRLVSVRIFTPGSARVTSLRRRTSRCASSSRSARAGKSSCACAPRLSLRASAQPRGHAFPSVAQFQRLQQVGCFHTGWIGQRQVAHADQRPPSFSTPSVMLVEVRTRRGATAWAPACVAQRRHFGAAFGLGACVEHVHRPRQSPASAAAAPARAGRIVSRREAGARPNPPSSKELVPTVAPCPDTQAASPPPSGRETRLRFCRVWAAAPRSDGSGIRPCVVHGRQRNALVTSTPANTSRLPRCPQAFSRFRRRDFPGAA